MCAHLKRAQTHLRTIFNRMRIYPRGMCRCFVRCRSDPHNIPTHVSCDFVCVHTCESAKKRTHLSDAHAIATYTFMLNSNSRICALPSLNRYRVHSCTSYRDPENAGSRSNLEPCFGEKKQRIITHTQPTLISLTMCVCKHTFAHRRWHFCRLCVR